MGRSVCFGMSLTAPTVLLWELPKVWGVMRNNLTFGSAALWVAGYFGVMLLYTFLDVAVWRKLVPEASGWMDLISTAVCAVGFLLLLQKRYPIRWMEGISISGLALALICAVGFYLVLDMGLDPLLAKAFPNSEGQYQEAVRSLLRFPFPAFLKVCVIAPVVEETLMRGFLLDGLRGRYGTAAALLVSAVVFALLHFNAVQTLSALVCGLALGLLYLHKRSILCCILAHLGYNALSYFVMLIKTDYL